MRPYTARDIENLDISKVDTTTRKRVMETRGAMLQEMDEINQQARADGSLDKEKQKRFTDLKDMINRLDQRLKNAGWEEKENQYFEKINTAVHGSTFGNGHESFMRPTQNIQMWESVSGDSKGKKIPVLNNRASLHEAIKSDRPDGMTWANYLRGRIAGYTKDNSLMGNFKNEMSTSADSALVPQPLSMDVIDLARNKSRIFQAGALTVPMDSKTLTIARVSGEPTPEWKAENAAHSSSDVTVEGVTFTANTLVASVKMSVELSEDAPNVSSIIANSLGSQLALELDRAALVGSGTAPEPQGIYGATNVQTYDMGTDGAALSNYDPFSFAYQKVLEANGDPNAVIFHPRTFGDLDRLKDANNQPLTAPASYQQLQKYNTKQIPINLTHGAASDASIAILGAYSNLMIGTRTQLRLEVTRVAGDSSGSAWENLQVWVRAYLRADVQLAHPDQFCVVEGIIPA